MDEPISVLIARAKGCSPEEVKSPFCEHADHREWRCLCPPRPRFFHAPPPGLIATECPTDMSRGYGYWITPAASFGLLAEMASDGANIELVMGELHYFCVDPDGSYFGDGFSETDVAKAWLAHEAWKAQL